MKVGGSSRDTINKARDDVTPRIMTTAEVAEYLHVSLAMVHRLVRRGVIPAFKIGRNFRFKREAIEKLIIDGPVKWPG